MNEYIVHYEDDLLEPIAVKATDRYTARRVAAEARNCQAVSDISAAVMKQEGGYFKDIPEEHFSTMDEPRRYIDKHLN